MVKVQNLTCRYQKRVILENLSFEIAQNEIFSLLGANGSGKSTLLKAIMGLIDYEGEIFIDGKNTKNIKKSEMAKYIAYVPQSSSIAFDFSVFDIVLMGRFHSSKLHINYSNNDKKIALEALEKIGILEFKDRAYANLSGGERQLVLIARAICQQSKMVIMDEPVTGLDLGNQIKLLKTIKNIQKDGGTIIQTTHYPDHALLISNSVLWIANGEIFACGEPTKIITPQRIKDVYGINSEFFTDKFGKSHIILSNNFKD